MIDSPFIPSQVKAVFQRFLPAFAATKPCLVNADLPCISNAFENVAIRGMEQGVRVTRGPLQFLFQRMLALDRVAVANFRSLPKDGGMQAVAIANYVLSNKAEYIQQYLHQPKNVLLISYNLSVKH